ncbi:MAG: hypothetical protein AB7U82_24680 [Blastocatellales bacterium]
MSELISLDSAARDLRNILAELSLGETITLTDDEGTPMALLVSLNGAVEQRSSVSDWQQQWEALAQEISAASPGERSLLEDLAEMRR